MAVVVVRILRFEFGESFLYNRLIRSLIGRAAANTAVLAIVALAAATLIGIPLGIFTGSRRGAAAALVRGVSLVCLSVCAAASHLALTGIRCGDARLLPPGGMTTAGTLDVSWSAWPFDVATQLPLPAVALALPIAATFERLQSQSMTDALHQPFALAAIAKGVAPRDVSCATPGAYPCRRSALCTALPSVCCFRDPSSWSLSPPGRDSAG